MPTYPKSAVRLALLQHTGLLAMRREGLAATVHRVGAVQMDPMRIVAQSHLLSLRLRRGWAGESALSQALARGEVLEANLKERCLLAAADRAAAVVSFQRQRQRQSLSRHGVLEAADAVLREIAERGPLRSRDIASSHRVPGFWDPSPQAQKATTLCLEILAAEGRLLVVARRGGERVYALPERLFPDWPALLADGTGARLAALTHYGRTLGVFRPSDPYLGWLHLDQGGRRRVLDEMVATGRWHAFLLPDGESYACDASLVPLLAEPSRPPRGVRILPPLDNLLWDRRRLLDLFGFPYTWEAYTPVGRRQVGPYGMPVLLGDRLMGEIDARRDAQGALQGRFVPRAALSVQAGRSIERAFLALCRDVRPSPREVPDSGR